MANLKLLLVLSMFVAAVLTDVQIIPQPIESSSIHPNGTTTPKTPETTVTQSPTHKPNTTTTSTTPPSTTTKSTTAAPPPHPNTTTTSTTAAPTPSPNTTTSSTTASPPITTAAPPAPVPEPQIGNWSVNFDKKSNNSCMVVDAAVQIEFLLVNGTTKKINLPVNATADGSCDDKRDAIDLKWDRNVFSLTFDKRNDSKFELEAIEATFVNLSLPNGVKNYTLVHNTPEFGTPLGNSYKCAKVQTFNLTEKNDNKTVAYLHLSHVQMQAFANSTGHKFDTAIDCEASPITSDVVPIVVGCVLAALVIMIMVAYLVARRRCQARGYLSMFADTKSESDYIPMKNLSCFN